MRAKLSLYILIFTISNSLIIASDSVVLSKQRIIVIKDIDEILVKETSSILITNSADAYLGFDSYRESDFSELEEMDAKIFNLNGDLIRELEDDDIKESTVSFSSIYNEHTTIYHNLQVRTFPYMINLSKEYVIKSTFFLPDWDPQENVRVNSAKLELVLEYPLEFKYRNIGNTQEPNISFNEDGIKQYSWEVKNINQYKNEYKSAPEARFQVGVKLEAVEFDLDGFKGSTKSWMDFGNWGYNMFKDHMMFSEGIEFGKQFKSIADKKERIKTVYSYLQENTRYVQIYLGIDGWRPHHVDAIHNFKYGDCKDLSVYMIAMLQKAGIEAFPGLVLTRDNGVTEADFPSNRFNHCIAVIPSAEDTLFLECTSNITSIDNIEATIEGVDVLLLDPKESRLLKTPQSTAEMNNSVFTAHAQINNDRSLGIKGEIKYTGNSAIDMRMIMKDKTGTEKSEWLATKFSKKSGNVTINSMDLVNLTEPDSNLTIIFNAEIKYFARKAGDRLIIEPAMFNRINFEGEEPAKRVMPLLNYSAYAQSESISFALPEGYKLKNSSKQDSITSSFGFYFNQLEIDDSDILWASEFRLNSRYIPLQDYAEYYRFMETSKKNTLSKLILIKE